jgi:hypothetical protein
MSRNEADEYDFLINLWQHIDDKLNFLEVPLIFNARRFLLISIKLGFAVSKYLWISLSCALAIGRGII